MAEAVSPVDGAVKCLCGKPVPVRQKEQTECKVCGATWEVPGGPAVTYRHARGLHRRAERLREALGLMLSVVQNPAMTLLAERAMEEDDR